MEIICNWGFQSEFYCVELRDELCKITGLAIVRKKIHFGNPIYD